MDYNVFLFFFSPGLLSQWSYVGKDGRGNRQTGASRQGDDQTGWVRCGHTGSTWLTCDVDHRIVGCCVYVCVCVCLC